MLEIPPSELNEDSFKDAHCTECGTHGKLRLEWRKLDEPYYVAKPIGTYSIAGVMQKVSVKQHTKWPWAVCGSCGAAKAAKL